jgi:hypothetical protein
MRQRAEGARQKMEDGGWICHEIKIFSIVINGEEMICSKGFCNHLGFYITQLLLSHLALNNKDWHGTYNKSQIWFGFMAPRYMPFGFD